jgi:hypothetical protein
MLILSVLWLLSNVSLMILAYHASISWAPRTSDEENIQICVIDADSGCFDPANRVWLFINVLFVILLVISVLWAAELENPDAGPIRTMSGIMILLGGLLLCKLINDNRFNYDVYITPLWVAILYLLIWLGLTIYTVLSND